MDRTASKWRGPRRATKVQATALALALVLAPAPPSLACSFHTDLPTQTVADWLIDGTEVVLARPDPENAFAYRVTEVIHSAGTAPELNLLVSSDLRHRLTANPDDAVLLAHDGISWFILAYVDPGFRPVMRQVLARAPGWGGLYHAERLEIFAGLQDSRDIDLRLLALTEIDKAPYGLLRQMELRLSPEALLRELWSPFGYGYQPIRVLLLGLSDSDVARAAVRDHLLRVVDWEWASNLGAFATAEIELNGADGVAFLESHYLARPEQPLDNLEQVVEALAIQHGVAPPEVRRRIAGALRDFVTARPAGAPLVARQFVTRQDWSQAALLAQVMEAKRLTSGPDLLAVAVYVAQARGAGVVASGSDG